MEKELNPEMIKPEIVSVSRSCHALGGEGPEVVGHKNRTSKNIGFWVFGIAYIGFLGLLVFVIFWIYIYGNFWFSGFLGSPIPNSVEHTQALSLFMWPSVNIIRFYVFGPAKQI